MLSHALNVVVKPSFVYLLATIIVQFAITHGIKPCHVDVAGLSRYLILIEAHSGFQGGSFCSVFPTMKEALLQPNLWHDEVPRPP